jgi:transcriptional regulator with XRE-family HTH domain
MGLIIKDVLKKKNISINEFADMLEINRVSLSSQINGNPTIETLEKWANLLEIDVSELFEQKQTAINCPNCGSEIKIKVE